MNENLGNLPRTCFVRAEEFWEEDILVVEIEELEK